MGLETYKEASKGFFRAFPDLKHTIEELIAGENDTVIVRETIAGTHMDTFLDIPATGCHWNPRFAYGPREGTRVAQ